MSKLVETLRKNCERLRNFHEQFSKNDELVYPFPPATPVLAAGSARRSARKGARGRGERGGAGNRRVGGSRPQKVRRSVSRKLTEESPKHFVESIIASQTVSDSTKCFGDSSVSFREMDRRTDWGLDPRAQKWTAEKEMRRCTPVFLAASRHVSADPKRSALPPSDRCIVCVRSGATYSLLLETNFEIRVECQLQKLAFVCSEK